MIAVGGPSDILEINGTRLECRAIGRPGSAPTLVFLHEGLGCVSLWRDFPDRLAARLGLPGLLYSRAGYGRSDPGKRPLPPDYHQPEAFDVLPKVLAAAGIDRPVLIGHSDGGTIALLYASRRHGAAPAAVVTIAAHVFNEEITVRGIVAARAAFRGTDLRDRLARHHGENVDGAFWGWCDVWLSPEFRDWSVVAALPGIAAPLLVLQGTADVYGSQAQVETIAAGVSGPAEAHLLPGLGHAPHLEAPETVAETIARFLHRHGIDRAGTIQSGAHGRGGTR